MRAPLIASLFAFVAVSVAPAAPLAKMPLIKVTPNLGALRTAPKIKPFTPFVIPPIPTTGAINVQAAAKAIDEAIVKVEAERQDQRNLLRGLAGLNRDLAQRIDKVTAEKAERQATLDQIQANLDALKAIPNPTDPIKEAITALEQDQREEQANIARLEFALRHLNMQKAQLQQMGTAAKGNLVKMDKALKNLGEAKRDLLGLIAGFKPELFKEVAIQK